MSQQALQLVLLLQAFALPEPLAWQAHLLVACSVHWGYAVPQGWTVRRERLVPPVPRKLAQLVLPVLAVRFARSELWEH